MKKLLLIAGIFSQCTLIAAGGHGAHWGYHGDIGPSNWSDLDPSYVLCREGNMQSPINVPTKNVKGSPMNVKFDIKNVSSAKILNNGETLEISNVDQNTLVFNGDRYKLLQFHMHTPSEHRIDDKPYDMELHYVYANKDKRLLVVGVFVKEGKSNPILKNIANNIPKVHKELTIRNVNISEALPKNLDSFQYSGSLTTPPCSQGVQWIVLKDPITASRNEISKINQAIGHNSRPVQDLNYREIF